MAWPVAWHLVKIHLLIAGMGILVAVADCTNTTCTAAGMFIQRRAISGKKSVETEEVDGPTWVASPFSGCKRVCQSDTSVEEFPAGFAFQDRSVQCFSRSGLLIGESHCAHLMKPRAYRRCWCGVSWCPAACEALTLTALVDDNDGSGVAGESDHDSDFECLGCYALGQDDDVAAVTVDAKDTTCVNWTSKTPCQSGLPFFRMLSNEMSVEACFEFCLSKGLDLFGLVKGAECRCGASRLNSGVWRSADPRPGLELADSDKIGSCATDEACPLRVYRWLGPFVSGGSVPEHLMMPRLEESVLIDSVVKGRLLNEGDEEDGPGASFLDAEDAKDAKDEEIEPALTQHGGNARWREGPAWHRLCDDVDGCQYARPWLQRTKVAPEGMTPEWEEYVIVRYRHDPATSTPTMREAFDAAAAEWRRHTCIALIEDPNAQYPYISVQKHSGSCFASLGRPDETAFVNLGWCENMNHKGNIIHEIGHTLGMHHKQMRPDGAETFEGHGPHLQVFWENVEDSWRSQYLPRESVYSGSDDDTKAHLAHGTDPQVGYAPYDFDSVMHYSRWALRNPDHTINDGYYFNTIPSEYNSVVGQRKGLSEGDIRQANDAYRCRLIGGTTLSTTTTTTTTTIPVCYKKGTRWQPLNMAGQSPTVEPEVEKCRQRCASVQGCAHFSWWPDGGCTLQDSSATIVSDPTPTSGPPTCSPTLCYKKGTRWQPLNMAGQSRTVEPEVEQCGQRCASVQGCAHFSWWPDGGCTLQDSSATIVSDPTPTSGPPTCSTTTTTTIPVCYKKGTRWQPLNMAGQSPTVEPEVEQCRQRCASVQGCAHFSWWPDGGCTLQDSSATIVSDPTPTSGPPTC